MCFKKIIYIPSIKKDIHTRDRDIFIIPGIDIMILDYLLCNFNVSILYMPFEEENKSNINKVKEIFNDNELFGFNYFTHNEFMKLLNEEENLTLITDILKVGIYFSVQTLKPSFYYIPFLTENYKISDDSGLIDLIITFSSIYELNKLLTTQNNIDSKLVNFTRRELL